MVRGTVTLMLVLLLAGCHSLRLPYLEPADDGDWVASGGTAQGQNARTSSIEPPLEKVWAGKTTAAYGSASAIGIDETVLVGNLKGLVTAFHVENGKKRGRKKLASAVEGGAAVTGSVMLVPNAWGRKVLVAYELKRGRALWSKRGVPVETAVLPFQESFVVADIEGNLRAYEAKTGEQTWIHKTDPTVGYFGSPAATKTVVIAANNRGEVIAVDRFTGEERWKAALNAPIYSDLSVFGETVYIPTTNGTLHALDVADGSEVWVYRTSDRLVRMTQPAVNAEMVVVGGSDGILRALDQHSGAEKWRSDLETAVTTSPLLVSGYVYTGDHRGRLAAHALDTGKMVWSDEVKGRIKSAMSIHDDHLVVLAEPRHVYAYRSVE